MATIGGEDWSITALRAGRVLELTGRAAMSPVARRLPVALAVALAAGLLEISGRRHEDFIEMTIRPDGSYELHGARTAGVLDAQGRVAVARAR